MQITPNKGKGAPFCSPGPRLHKIAALILTIPTLCLSTSAANCGESPTNDRAPNIVLILVDDLGWAGRRPVFLNLCYHTVHTPIEAKQEVVDRYAKKLRPDLRHQNPTYAAMVHSLDENVGRVLDKLDALGVADRTVVILTSDNGGFINPYRGRTVTSNHPLRSGKGSLWEGGVRVPLLIRWPGVAPAGLTCREPVVSTDFYPTILKMTGLAGDAAHNAAVDGVSLVPLLKNPQAALGREAIYFHYPHYYPTTTPVSSVRAGDWKLLEFHEDQRVELYNLAADPGEQNDLAAQLPERAEQLRRRLHAWREAVDAQMPEPNPARQPKMSRVSGIVTLDGQPVAGARITFLPAKGGRPASGVTDGTGEYRLTTFEKDDGAAPGRYAVTVVLKKTTGPARETWIVPKRYADPKTTGLQIEVAPGINRIDFDLRSD